MNREDIVRMAREAGLHIATDVKWMPIIGLEYAEKFAKLVAQHEREACAKLEIELILSPAFFATMGEYDAHKDAVLAYRNLIRARGQA
jgi:hypothetical protein